MTKRALITGLTGQDGSYLAELLLEKGYQVHGLRRRSSSFNTGRVDHLLNDFRHEKDARLILHYGDLADATSLSKLLYKSPPSRREFRQPQDHSRYRANQARPPEEALPRQSRCVARLGLRAGIRRGDVAHAPAVGAGRLRHCDRRVAHGAGVRDCRVRARGPRFGSGTSRSIRSICVLRRPTT